MKRRLTLTVATLQGGGAERVLTGMANYWASRGWDITIVTLSRVSDDFYMVDPAVNRIGLDELRPSNGLIDSIFSNLRRVYRLRKTLKGLKPEIVISFLDTTNILTLLASIGLGLKVIVSERVDLASTKIHPVWVGLRKMIYRRAAVVVVQTEKQYEFISQGIGLAVPVRVISNPLFESTSTKGTMFNASKYDAQKKIVGMGRLEAEKGFDLLVRAFEKVNNQHPEWRCYIFGDGTRKGELEFLIERYELKEKVFLPGRIANPSDALAWADIFVLSSRSEGFPNVLLEAMAQGTPVVSFDCPSGPAYIIEDNVDGLMVPNGDVDALAGKLSDLMKEPDLRKRLGDHARKVRERFSEQRIMEHWEELVENVVDSQHPAENTRRAVL